MQRTMNQPAAQRAIETLRRFKAEKEPLIRDYVGTHYTKLKDNPVLQEQNAKLQKKLEQVRENEHFRKTHDYFVSKPGSRRVITIAVAVLLLLLRRVFVWCCWPPQQQQQQQQQIALLDPCRQHALDQVENYKPETGFCSRLPKGLSTSYLWNQAQHQQQEQQQAPFRTVQLRKGVCRQPVTAWNNVLERLHSRSSSSSNSNNDNGNEYKYKYKSNRKKNKKLQIWILANPLDVTTTTDQSSSWISLLQDESKKWLGADAVNNIEWTILAEPFATTPYYTQVLQQTILATKNHDKKSKSSPPPDIIFHALSRHEIQMTDLANINPSTVAWEEERRFVLQDFVRAVRGSSSSSTCQPAEPAIVFLDDHVPSSSSSLSSSTAATASLWVHEVNARMLHQVADHYDVGLISYARVAQRLVYAEEKEESSMDSGSVLALRRDDGRYSALGHQAIVSTILYALLDFTVQSCSHREMQQQQGALSSSPLVSDEVLRRVETVLPPLLNGKQSLMTVSQEWKEQEDRVTRTCSSKQQRDSKHSCPSSYWAGGTKITQLGQVKRQEGWRMLSDGRLQVAKQNAKLQWSIPLITSSDQMLKAQLFVVLAEEHNHDAPLRLQWTVASKNKSATTTGSYEVPSSIVLGVAVPLTLELPSMAAAEKNTLDFDIEVFNGPGLDLTGFFLCDQIP